MKIRMLTLSAGPEGVRAPGQVYDVPADEGQRLIAAGAALAVDGPREVASRAGSPEHATLPAGLKALRGGWYELPNGEKVHGREAAEEALAAADEGDDEAEGDAETC